MATSNPEAAETRAHASSQGTNDRIADEMKVTFDTDELCTFFDHFAPLECPAELYRAICEPAF